MCYLRRMTTDGRNSQTLAGLSLWIAAQMLAGETETRILDGLCERLAALGVVLKRVIIGADTLHPVLEGRAFEWRREENVKEVQYGRQAAIGVSDSWRRSPFYYLLSTAQERLRRRVPQDLDIEPVFPVVQDLAPQGTTDYVAYCNRLGGGLVIGEMDCVFSSWTTDREGGFTEFDLM